MLSVHLRSRHEVGTVLATGDVPTTELRAAVIIGSGSASFEMLRNLVEVLPAMITPRWVRTRCQPIAIRDVLHYLCAVLETAETAGRTVEIGGPDVVTYEDMMSIYAQEAKLNRRLIAGADLGWRSAADPMPTDPTWSGGTVLDDIQTVHTDRAASEVFASLCSVGGERGWLVADHLWSIRGWIDKVIGGVGMRRGRRHPTELRVGDALDFWRVEALVPDTLLRLRAEMRLPGKAWLEWTISEDEQTCKTQLIQRARYQPRGIAGRIYWYALLPFHGIILKGLAHALVRPSRKE